jgi:VanZ family protein
LGFANWDRRFLAGTTAIGIGIFLEVAQDAWAGRNGSVADALSNTAGVILGLIAAYVVLKLWERLSSARAPS